MKSIVVKNLEVSFKLRQNSKLGFRAQYSNFEALKNINLEINSGDRVGILGVNGAGKTTLLRALSGILPPTSGSVDVTGRLYPALSLRGSMIGEASVLENIVLRGKYFGLINKDLDEFVEKAKINADLESFLYQPVKTLSKGMRSRLITSLFSVTPADIYIFDEWIGTMDRTQFNDGQSISSIIDSSEITVLASHKLMLLKKYCNRGIILYDGEVVFDEHIDNAIKFYKKNY